MGTGGGGEVVNGRAAIRLQEPPPVGSQYTASYREGRGPASFLQRQAHQPESHHQRRTRLGHGAHDPVGCGRVVWIE